MSDNYLPPQDKKDVVVLGYVTLRVRGLGTYVPRGACPWSRRALYDGENVVNRNDLASWEEHDETFRKHLESGAIQIGESFHPLAEVTRVNEGRESVRVRELSDRIARLEAQLEKGGKK